MPASDAADPAQDGPRRRLLTLDRPTGPRARIEARRTIEGARAATVLDSFS